MRLQASLGFGQAARLGALALALATALPCVANSGEAELFQAERLAEILIVQRINAERAALAPGAPFLVTDPTLDEIARARSEAMAHGAPFSHEDAFGRHIATDMMKEHFGPYGTWGENILEEHGFRVFDPAAFARRAVEGWMNSPGHRRNILSPAYSRSSIGVAVRGNQVFATEVFMGPVRQAAR